MLKEYIENHKEEIITIPMKNITLTEKIHNHGKFTLTDKPSEDLIIAVRQIEQDMYSLVVGWAEYMEARGRAMENIKCVVTTDNRHNFVRKNLKTYHIGKIKIPEQFKKSPPRPEKIQQKIDYYKEHGQFRRKLRIDRTRMLYDGYATYLAAKQLGLKVVPAEISEQKVQIHK